MIRALSTAAILLAFAQSPALAQSVAPDRDAGARHEVEPILARAAALRSTLGIAPGARATVPTYLQEIRRQIGEWVAQVVELSATLDDLCARNASTCAEAHFQEGLLDEALADAFTNADLRPLPDDLQRRLHAATPPGSPVSRVFDDQIRELLQEEARPRLCEAVIHFAVALREAQAGGHADLARRIVASAHRIGLEEDLVCTGPAAAVLVEVRAVQLSGITFDAPAAPGPPPLDRSP